MSSIFDLLIFGVLAVWGVLASLKMLGFALLADEARQKKQPRASGAYTLAMHRYSLQLAVSASLFAEWSLILRGSSAEAPWWLKYSLALLLAIWVNWCLSFLGRMLVQIRQRLEEQEAPDDARR